MPRDEIVSSPFYPQLEDFYAAESRDWLSAVKARKKTEDEE